MSHVLTPEGSSIALNGSHEARVWAALPVKGQGTPVTPKELEAVVGSEVAKVGQGRAFKNKWIAKDGSGLVKLVRRNAASTGRVTYLFMQTESIDDSTQKDMHEVDSTGTLKAGEKALAELRKRKLIVQKYVTSIVLIQQSRLTHFRKGQWFTVHKGKNFSTSTAKPETDLTAEMLTSCVI